MNEKRQRDLLVDKLRGDQLLLLRCIHLQTSRTKHGIGVSPAMQVALLRLIDDHDGDGQGCFASQKTLAAEIGCSVTTVGRTVEVLVNQSFVTIDDHPSTDTNNHRIVWNELHAYHKKQSRRSVVTTGAVCRDDRQNETETQHVNATSTATIEPEWLLLRRRLRDLGMKAAAQATNAARERGLSLDYVDELIRKATERKRPIEEPYGVAHLC